MLEVLPIQTKDAQKKACEACGAEYRPQLLAYAAYGDGRFCGVCQFRMAPEGGIIETLDQVPGNEEFQPMFVMGRAALSFMEQCGAETGYYDGPVDDSNRVLIGAVGFRPDPVTGRYKVDLKGFFEHPCSAK